MKITKRNISAAVSPDANIAADKSTQAATKEYATKLGELTVETLLDLYHIYADYTVSDEELVIKAYADPYKSAVYSTSYTPFTDIIPDDADLNADAEYLAGMINEGWDDASYSEVLSTESIPDEEDVYAGTKSNRWQDSWQYERIKELGYPVEVTDDSVTIKFDDGDVYASFKLIPPDDPSDPYDEWMAKDSYGDMVSMSFDYTDSYDEIVTGCLNYFLTRY